ncbi:hypothetical protein Lsai_0540 [Legionella sainthelensi]|uniref:Uncharacterized protein n=1 Tax=Legionella sainthelensi TaxID=28087 RepID=A0A0W0YRX7_9GAMM|nr:hypothetical protein [Legionella sainthelensi]KTD59629.1 hypothetical protein Lsai_0540 [Legionella sainthelensi]VEH30140.1 Uncharacterised protein [Legionella sainthelensi]
MDSAFRIDIKSLHSAIADEIRVLCEGETDRIHLEVAINHFHAKGTFLNLKLVFPSQEYGGDKALQNKCLGLSSSSQTHLTICLFDRDNKQIIHEMAGSTSNYKDHGNNVFSLVIPPFLLEKMILFVLNWRLRMSKIIDAMLETAKDLRLDAITIKEIEMLNLSEVKELEAQEIKKCELKKKLAKL